MDSFGGERMTRMVLLGLAGPAEAAIGAALGLMCIGVFMVMVCAAIGLVFRSRVAAVIGLLLVGISAFLFLPWEAFFPEPSNDPDVHYWQKIYLNHALWWVLASVTLVGAVVRAFWSARHEIAEGRRPAG
jgi:hypothetical protein